MQVILDSSFARPGSAPIWGGEKGEFRDWTSSCEACSRLGGLWKSKGLATGRYIYFSPDRRRFCEKFIRRSTDTGSLQFKNENTLLILSFKQRKNVPQKCCGSFSVRIDVAFHSDSPQCVPFVLRGHICFCLQDRS